MKLIDKDALVAWAKETYLCENASMIRKVCYKQLVEHLDTLEVKEVDLESEFNSFLDNKEGHPRMWHSDEQIEWAKNIAKHFFELGLKAQIMTSKLQQRISVLKMSFWTGLQTFEETEMTLSDAYNQGVDDILEELGLKAQKG